jgi:Tfp pilus assembly protein PilF
MNGAARAVTRRAPVASSEVADTLVIQARDVARLVADAPRDGMAAATALADRARAAGCADAEVVACRSAAWAARELYDHATARRFLGRARRVASAAGLDRRLGQVWVTWSAVHLELGDLRAATRDLAAARRAFAPDEPVELTFAEGLVAQKAGRVAAAVAAYRSAVASAGPSEADVRFKAANNLGEVLAEAGRLDEADAALAVAASTAGSLSRVFAAIAAVNRGGVAVQRGHLASAERHYARAEALAAQAGMPLVEFRLEQVRALRAAGLWPEAVARLDGLVSRFDAPGAALLLADAHLLLAEASVRAGLPAAARSAAAEARRLFTRQHRPADRAAAVVVEAEAALAAAGVPPPLPVAVAPPRGASAAAASPAGAVPGASGVPVGLRAGPGSGEGLSAGERAALRRAARMLDERGELEWAVAAWLLVGRVEAAAGRTAAAVAAWERGAARGTSGPVLVRTVGHLARALAAPSAAACRRACAAGLADIEAHREAVASTELRARLARHGRALTDAALATLPPGGARRLFGWLEAGRSIGQVTTGRTSGAGGAGGGGAAAEAALVDDLAALSRLAHDEAAAGPEAGPGGQERLAHRRRLEDRVRRRAWADAGATGRRRPLDAGTVLGGLGPATLVSYGLVGGDLVAVTLCGGRARRHDLGPLGPVAGEARNLAFLARRLPSARPAAVGATMAAVHESLARLDAALLAPALASAEARAAAGAGDRAEVVVVPVGPLASVPWGALPSAAGRPTRVVPSARSFVDTAPRLPVDAPPAAAGAPPPGAGADVTPRGVGDVPRPGAGGGRAVLVAGPGLPGAGGEVRQLAALRPGATVLAGDEASGAAVVAALDGAALAHLACHGRPRRDAPLFSALVLADGPITAYDLERVARLPATVVLAACDAGLVASPDEDDPGDPLGVPSVLLQRGARSVVAATVPVPDVDTSNLMVALHERLLAGAPVAAALAAARARVDVATPAGLATSLAFTCFG